MEKEKIDVALAGAKKAGIQNIVALRGGKRRLPATPCSCVTQYTDQLLDAPEGQAEWSAVEGGFTCALDLVKYIREQYGDYFCISVSGAAFVSTCVILNNLCQATLKATRRLLQKSLMRAPSVKVRKNVSLLLKRVPLYAVMR